MLDNDLFIKRININKNDFPTMNKYPYNIKAIKDFKNLKLDCPVTFIVGDNGIGKSTFIEALAVACGLNPEGGTENFTFHTKNTHSDLYKYFKLERGRIPQNRYFLRAESFYNVSTEIVRLSEEGGQRPLYSSYGGNLHECSHGEAFIKLVENRFGDNGLYILDEPEAALSPIRQMTLLTLIHNLVKRGSQFIIATHSPILISYPEAVICDLNNNFQEIEYEDTEIYQVYKLFLERYPEMHNKLFSEEGTDEKDYI